MADVEVSSLQGFIDSLISSVSEIMSEQEPESAAEDTQEQTATTRKGKRKKGQEK